MKHFPNQGLLQSGIPLRSVPQRRAPLAVTVSAPKVADTFSAADEAKLAKAMGVEPPKVGGLTLVETIVSHLMKKPATMDDLIIVAGKGRRPDTVRQTVYRMVRQGRITSESPNDIAIYRAEPSVKIATQAQIAKDRRMETWRRVLKAAHSFGRPATAKEIAAKLGKRRDTVGQQLKSIEAEGMVTIRRTLVNVAQVYTVTPAGVAFMEGGEE